MDPSRPLGMSRSCVGQCREEGKYVAVGSKAGLGEPSVPGQGFQFDPFVHGELPLEQWDVLERLD